VRSARWAPDRRQELVEGTVSYLLERGLVGLSLRPLAKALGTSDRMLLYYFSNRDEIIENALMCIGAHIQGLFRSVLPETGASPMQAVQAVIHEMGNPVTRSHLQVWVEILALASRGDAICERVADSVTSGWSDSLCALLSVPPRQAAGATAAVIGLVGGMIVFQLADRDDLVHATRRYLSETLPEPPTGAQARRGKEQIA
jgi:AcrR family transcriptional regulator